MVSEIKKAMESYRTNSAKYGTEIFNPFKHDTHAKLIYLIDRQPAMQQGEIWQFFRQLTKPKEQKSGITKPKEKQTEKELFEKNIYWRDRRSVDQTTNKYLLELENKNIIKKKTDFGKPITFNPITYKILPYEIKPNGDHSTKESKPKRYFLQAPLFELLIKAFKIDDYFTGKVNHKENIKAYEKLKELAQADLDNPTTQADVTTILGLSNFDLKQAQEKIGLEKQLKEMQFVTGVCQTKIAKDFLQKLNQDFEDYYKQQRNLETPLKEIYNKEPFSIDYYQILNDFLSQTFRHEQYKIYSARLLKEKKYNYAETFILGQVKIILHYKEKGIFENTGEIKNLQKLWNNKDPLKKEIDQEYLKYFNNMKKIHLKDGHLPSCITH